MKKSTIFTFAFAIILAFAVIVNTSDLQADKPSSSSVYQVTDVMESKNSKKPHDFSWKQGKDDVFFTEKYKGKVVFLNIWGTWCPPCRREIPDIIKLQDKFADQGLQVIGIATERGQDISANVKKVSGYVENAKINYPNFVMSYKQISKTYAPRAVPTTLIIDRNGDIVDKVVGGMDYESFKKLVEKYL